MGPSDIVGLEAVDLAAAIRARQVSCVEVMQAHLARIEAFNPTVNAVIGLVDPDDLRRQAAACDDALNRGEAVGPLHGFPHAVKDLQPVRGLSFTQGSPIFRDVVAPADSPMVERLRAGGVIFIGKTNTPEFGLGSHTYNPVHGVTRNPYDLGKSAGGSSGGAAAALALRMVPLADGSDYGGSLRNPAGWNNVLGFRTSFGRVPVHVRDDWNPSMGVLGPMARTVADLALLLSVQAGFDPRAPLSAEGDGKELAGPIAGDVRGKRIGWLGDFGGAAPCEPGVLALCAQALKVFDDLGCVVEAALPASSAEAAWDSFKALRAWQAGANLFELYKDPGRRALMKPEAVYEVEAGLKLTAFDVSAHSIARSEWSRAVNRLFDAFDYLVAPTAQVFPFDVAETWPRRIAGQTMDSYHAWMKGACLLSLSGCPALAMPAGFGVDGLPMGVQIIGPVHREMDCLVLGKAYEAATQWVRRRPPNKT